MFTKKFAGREGFFGWMLCYILTLTATASGLPSKTAVPAEGRGANHADTRGRILAAYLNGVKKAADGEDIAGVIDQIEEGDTLEIVGVNNLLDAEMLNHGHMILNGSAELILGPQGKVANSGKILVQDEATFDNFIGTVDNLIDGEIVVEDYGEFDNSYAEVANSGKILVQDEATFDNGAKVSNSIDGEILVQDDALFANSYGEVANSGKIVVQDEATFDNSKGTVHNTIGDIFAGQNSNFIGNPPEGNPVQVSGDPHFHGAHGDNFAFRGRNNTLYVLLAALHLQVNALFVPVSFVMGGTCKACTQKTVHGSFIQAVYFRALTQTGKTVRVEYRADTPSRCTVLTSEATEFIHELPADLLVSATKPDGIEEIIEDVFVRLERKHAREASVAIRNSEFEVLAASRYLAYAGQNKNRKRIDIGIRPLKDLATLKVAPHGLIGQTFDLDEYGFDGALDDYSTDVVYTKAMGEGAIEGSAADYEVPAENPYSWVFKYVRYNATSAPPRDTSSLTGVRRKVEMGLKALSAGAVGDDVAVTNAA